ncbi:MAG: lysophospholipid acyltransferase family protein [Bacteroidota bacterium]
MKILISRLVWLMVYALSLLPLSILRTISEVLYLFSYYLFNYRQHVIIQNLARSFPEKNYDEIQQLARQNMQHLFALFPQWMKQISISKNQILSKIQVRDKQLLQTMSEDNKNYLLVLGHYGNWEYLAALPMMMKKPVYALYKKQKSAPADFLSMKWRSRFGVKLLESSEAARFMIKHRDQPAVYIQIADQRPPKNTTKSVLFLNQQTPVITGVEKLQPKINAGVVYLEIMPHQNYRYYSFNLTDISGAEDITRSYFAALEHTIQKAPKYYLWSHKRWKRYAKPNGL